MIHKDDYTYLLYGDSISKGVVYDKEKSKYVISDKSFPSLLQGRLKGIICNAGRFGNTILKAASRLHSDVLKKKPDIVIVEFGGNDCDFDWNKIAINPHGTHKPRTDFQTFESILKDVINTLKQSGIVPVLMNLPPIDAERYFKWISKDSITTGEKILTWLGTVGRIYWWQERYNSVIVRIAHETKTRLIDVRSAFLKHPDYREFICHDGIHPNEDGHKLIAEKFIEYIKSGYSFLLSEHPLSST